MAMVQSNKERGMENLMISIITISYNCASEIEDTILSVVNQTYPNKEYLLIDGGSTDGTMNIVEKYKDKIDIIISEPDKGISDAFNKGIKRATGDYIVMMNAGDMLTDDALNKFASASLSKYGVIKGNTIRWNTETGGMFVEKAIIKYPSIPFNFMVGHQATYIRKDIYEKFGGYDLNLHIAMDFELMLRLCRNGVRFYALKENLAIFRMGGISQMTGQKRIDEMIYAMKKNGRNTLQCNVFTIYLKMRTSVRNILNRINPDIKNRIIAKKCLEQYLHKNYSL